MVSLSRLDPPPYLSASSIETFLQCPLKYKLSKIDKLEEGQTEQTTRGKFVHAVLEDLYKLPAEERTLAAARSIMRAIWDEEWETEAKTVVPEHELKLFRWKSWWAVEKYFSMEDPTKIEPGGIETELLVEIEGVPIKGFVDRWDPFEDGISIVDYKTGKTPRPQYREPKFRQLLIYADGLSTQVNLPARKMNLLYVTDGVRLARDVNPDEIDKMRETVVTTYEAVKQKCVDDSFEPTVNSLCNWCAFKPICPAWVKP